MEVVTKYRCEVCAKLYDEQKQAEACEAQKEFDATQFPPGILFPYFHHGFVGIFCAVNVRNYENDQHIGQCNLIAFRAEGFNGDSTFESGLCGHEFLSGEKDQTAFQKFYGINQTHWRGRECTPEDLIRPEFIRGARYLVEHGIKPLYINEAGEVCEYFLAEQAIPENFIVVEIPGGHFAISKFCPQCTADITPTMFTGAVFNGSIRTNVDQWACGCGHSDKYVSVVARGIRVDWSVETELSKRTKHALKLNFQNAQNMLGDIVGYCQIKPDAVGQSPDDLSKFRGKPCLAMEINHSSKSVLVIDPEGTAMGMFDFDQIQSMFECQCVGGLLIPPGIDPIEAMMYSTRVLSDKRNQQRDMNFIRKMIVFQSLMKGKFCDTLYFNFSK